MKKDKKKIIMKSALEIFAEKGFENTLVEEIAKKASVGKGTIYLYFKSKEELYIGVFQYMIEKWEDYIKEIFLKQYSATEQLKAYIEKSIFIAAEHKSFRKFLIKDAPLFSEKIKGSETLFLKRKKPLKKIIECRIKPLKKIIKYGIDNNEFKKTDIELISVMIIGMINTYIFYYIILKNMHNKKTLNKMEQSIMNILLYKEE